jgi:hypothetical protein
VDYVKGNLEMLATALSRFSPRPFNLFKAEFEDTNLSISGYDCF